MVKTDDHMRKVNYRCLLNVYILYLLCLCLFAGEGESVESAEGVGTQGEVKKAQRTQEVWKEGKL